jgi:predicted RNA-binding protein with PIN domain
LKILSNRLYTKWIIIDGFNLIYKFDHLHSLMKTSNLSNAMDGLINIISNYQKQTKKEITIVFDGKKKEGDNTSKSKIRNISIIYSLTKTADEVITKYIKDIHNPADYTVITSDKQVISYVKNKGAKNMLSENFEKLVSSAKANRPDITPKEDEKQNIVLTNEDINFWEKLFSNQN